MSRTPNNTFKSPIRDAHAEAHARGTKRRSFIRSAGRPSALRPSTVRTMAHEALEPRSLMAADATPGIHYLDQVASAVKVVAPTDLSAEFAHAFSRLEKGASRPPIIVDSPLDTIANDGVTTLRESLLLANRTPGLDVIEFAPSMVGKTIQVDDRGLGAFSISDDTIIRAPWADDPETLFDERPTIDGGGADGYGTRIFDIDDKNTSRQIQVDISGLVLTNGQTRAEEGAAVRNAEALRMSNMRIVGNRAHWEVYYARNDANSELKAFGGAIVNTGTLDLVDSQVVANSALSRTGGGAIHNSGDMRISGSVIAENQTSGEGGAVVNTETGRMRIEDSCFERNMAFGSGGAIRNRGLLSMHETDVVGNASRGDIGGGGLMNSNVAFISDSRFQFNQVMGVGTYGVSLGGGAILSLGVLNVTGSEFERNSVNVPSLTERNQLGGGILIHSGSAHIEYSTFRDNHARQGGGLFVMAGRVSVTDSDFISNDSMAIGSAQGRRVAVTGPAIDNRSGRLELERSNAYVDNILSTYGNSAIARTEYERAQGVFLVQDALPASAPSVPASSVSEVFDHVFSELEHPNASTPIVVTTPLDTIANDGVTSLREALLLANSRSGRDVITLHPSLAGRTIQLEERRLGALDITDDVVIRGIPDNPATGQDERVTIDGGGADGYGTRILDINDGRLDHSLVVDISGLILANGWTRAQDGAAVRNFESTRLTDVKFLHNQANWDITYARAESALDWNPNGGAIANYHNLDLVGVDIEHSVAEGGEGGAIYNAWRMRVSDSAIQRNRSTAQGGAIYNDRRGQLEITDSAVANNVAYGAGGGILNRGSLTLDGTVVTGNVTQGDLGGGGIANLGNLVVHDSTFSLNLVVGVGREGTSVGGAAIYSTGTLFVSQSLFEKNAVNVPSLTERNQSGGAIHVGAGFAHISDSTFVRNKARDGGAIFVANGEATVASSSFQRNESLRLGTPGVKVAVAGPAVAVRHGDLLVDKHTEFVDNRLAIYGNSSIANSNYRRTQRSMFFDEA